MAILKENDMLEQSAEPAPLPPETKPFIRATEVWTPDGATGLLRLASGHYGAMTDFEAVSQGESFALGEGLPGRAWAEARPVVLKGFRGSYFKRTEAAEAAGLTAGVAVPVFAGETLKGVVVFLLGDDEERIGAVEVWQSDGEPGSVMTLEEGYFGAARHFEWISRHTQFPHGTGLPGGVWAKGAAVLMQDLGASHRFIRAESAGAAGITTGLGIPVPSPAEGVHVLTLLSARSTPIARRFEIWEAAPDGSFLLTDGLCEIAGPLAREERIANPGTGVIGQVAATGRPLCRSGVTLRAPAGAEGGPQASFASVVALPIHKGGRLAQIAAWYL